MRQRFAILGGLLAMLPASAGAESVGGSVTSFGVGEWLGLMLRLGLVIGVIWAAVYAMRWYTRRVGGERRGALRSLDIIETRTLGPNRALHLVRLGERAVLIGVTPERINALMEITDPEVLEGLELTSGGTSRPAAFGALLAGLGAGASKSSQAVADEPVRATSMRDLLSRGTKNKKNGPSEQASKALATTPKAKQPAKQKAPRRPKRTLADRVFGSLGFAPVESTPQAIARLRAQAQADQVARAAAQPMPMPETMPLVSASLAEPIAPPPPAPKASLFERLATQELAQPAPSVAPSATQTLRALSGYAAAQQSSQVATDASLLARESRIAEAQRAIMAARQQAS